MNTGLKQILACSVAAIALMNSGEAYAEPQGGVVIGGSADISQAGNKTDIHQSSDKAIIDWRSFDIAPGEHTEFHQPSSSSATLNRINDTDPSKIDGQLTANGHIMLVNPNGVVFGKGAQVDVGSITATTADIDNDDFMNGNLDFDRAGATDGKIINKGRITAGEAGLVNLVAPRVENHGVIAAKLGKVNLAAADTFTLDMAGDGLTRIAITAEDARKLVRNTGAISAEGGTVALTAGQARSLVDSLVDNSGIIEAASMTKQGGKIILGGEDTDMTVNRGVLDVSGRKNKTRGGQVEVTGQHIALQAGSVIDASGTANVPTPKAKPDTATMTASGEVKSEEEFMADDRRGGGSIKVGGDYKGEGRGKTSTTTDISDTATIKANAIDHGDGGRVTVWADKATRFEGEIEAKGGSQDGNGGFAEVSGKEYLDFRGDVDLSGKRNGTLLLDPDNIDIEAGIATPPPLNDNLLAFDEGASRTVIGADILGERLTENANVILEASNTIDVNADVVSTGAGDLILETAANGTITINNAIDMSTGDLILISDLIDINNDISAQSILTKADSNIDIDGIALTSNGHIILNADRDADKSGAIDIRNSTINTNGGDFIAGGGLDPTTNFAYDNNGSRGIYIRDSNISTDIGSVFMAGSSFGGTGLGSATGLKLHGSAITTSAGNINLKGDVDSEKNNVAGISIVASGLQTDNGNIKINGNTSLSGTQQRQGLLFGNFSRLKTISGNINLTGSGANGGRGISISGNNGIETENGDIVLSSLKGDLLLDKNITKTGIAESNVILRSADNIILSKNIIATSGKLNAILNADRDANQSGAISIQDAGIRTRGGDIIAGGGLNPETTYAYGDTDSNIFRGIDLDNGRLFASSGNIILNGHGTTNNATRRGGIYMQNGSVVNTTMGNIALNAKSTSSGDHLSGMLLDHSTISTEGGDINMAVQSDSSALDAYGLRMVAGDILIEGKGDISLSIDANNGEFDMASGSTIGGADADGDISIKANGMFYTASDTISTNGNINLKSYDDNIRIGLGGAAGIFQLNHTELSNLSARDTLTIGNGTNDIYADSVNLASSGYNLNLNGNNITVDNGLTAETSLNMLAHNAITLNGTVSASGSGDSIILSGQSFTNNAGETAINPGAGRYLIYADNWQGTTLNNLSPDFKRYGKTYDGYKPDDVTEAGNGIFYRDVPTLVYRVSDDHIEYGQDYFGNGKITYHSGLVDDDRLDDLGVIGAADYLTMYRRGNNAGSYTMAGANGTLQNEMGYNFAFINGDLNVDKAKVTVTANNVSFTQNTSPRPTYRYDGFKMGDTPDLARISGTPSVNVKGYNKLGALSAGTYTGKLDVTSLTAQNYRFVPGPEPVAITVVAPPRQIKALPNTVEKVMRTHEIQVQTVSTSVPSLSAPTQQTASDGGSISRPASSTSSPESDEPDNLPARSDNNTPQKYATRSDGLISIDQKLIDYYDLCSYSAAYCQ